MKSFFKLILLALSMLIINSSLSFADLYELSFTKLTGTTGGSPALTAVYYADLSNIATISGLQSITIADDSYRLGGAGGQFSGFDLDAIVLSYTHITNAQNISTLDILDIINYSDFIFYPGDIRGSGQYNLFGTDSTGNYINNNVATLGVFDGNATTDSTAAGFLSMGDNGVLSLNFTNAITNTSGLYLYIGEVGDNGEIAASNIYISEEIITPPITPTPEPSTLLLVGAGLTGFLLYRRRQCNF